LSDWPFYLGWTVAFHITIGFIDETGQANDDNFFFFLYMAFGKTLAMFAGNISFNKIFMEATSLGNEVLGDGVTFAQKDFVRMAFVRMDFVRMDFVRMDFVQIDCVQMEKFCSNGFCSNGFCSNDFCSN
jgi:hypothetical protein